MLNQLAVAAGVPAGAAVGEAPIERIYRALVQRVRAGLRIVREDAA